MEKPIIMHFHQEKDHKDFIEMIRETANKDGEFSLKLQETEEAVVIEVIKV